MTKIHEPCASRGECYHVRAGRVGGRIGGYRRFELYGSPATPEGCSKGGKAGGHENVKSGQITSIATHDSCLKGGRIGGRIVGRTSGRIQGRKNAESGHLTSIRTYDSCSKGGRTQGRRNVETGQLAKIHKLYLGRKPSWPEVRFYGLVFGDPITASGFSAQQSDGHGIYDGAWCEKKIIVELDGGGHHAFRDRHAEDTQKDIARMLDGNKVLRETDESILYLKTLAILESEL